MVDSLVNDDSSSPDGACVVKINGVEIPILVIELENLLCDSGLDPSIQIGRSMRDLEACLQPKVGLT